MAKRTGIWNPRTWWAWLIEPPSSFQPAQQRQSRLLSTMLVVLIGLGLVGSILPNILFPLEPWWENTGLLLTIAVALILVFAYGINRKGHYVSAAWLTILILNAGIFADVLSSQNLSTNNSLFYLILPILFASILLSERAALAVAVLNVVGILLLPAMLAMSGRSAEITPLTFIILLSAVILLVTRHRNLLETDRQNQLEAILRELPAGITVQDASGKLLYANDQAAVLTGYPSAEALLNAPAATLADSFEVVDESGKPLGVEERPSRLALRGQSASERVLRFRARNMGEEHWALVRVAPLMNATGQARMVVNVFQDIGLLKRSENAQRFLAEASILLNDSLDYEATLATIARLAVPTIADWCTVNLRYDGKIQQVTVVHQDPEKMRLGHELQARYPTPLDARYGIPNVISTGKSEFIPRITPAMVDSTARDAEHRRLLQALGFRSLITVPLNVHGQTLGALTFMLSETPRIYDENDLLFAEDLARRAALAIENARLYEETRQQRERLRITLASIGDAVITTDDEGCITFMNPVAEQATGWSLDDAIGKQLAEVFHIINEATRQPVESPVVKVMREGTVVGLANHTLLIAKDGREIPIDDSGAPIRSESGAIEGVVLVFRDVSERKEAEMVIQRQADLLQFANDAIFVWEFGNKIVQWYHGAELVYGFTAAEAVGRNAQSLLHTQAPLPWNEVEGILEKTGSWIGELRHTARDGREVSVESRLALVNYGDGRKLVLEINLDITERKRIELERQDLLIREQTARLQAEEAVRTRDEFLSVAAHELRTPITSLRGFAQVLLKQILRDETLDTEKLRRATHKIDEQSEKLARLIAQLLDISRLEAGRLELNREPVDLAGLAQELADNAQMNTQHHQIVVHAVPVVAEVDRLRLEQVIMNLLDNAIRYSPQGGQIDLDVTKNGQHAEIAVTDRGLGIAPDYREHLFERFYQAHPGMSVGGLGLGLFISHQIIERHSGQIRAEFPPEGGTRFVVTLPLRAEPQG